MDYSITFYICLEDPVTHFRRAPASYEIDLCIDEAGGILWSDYRETCFHNWESYFDFGYNVIAPDGDAASSLSFTSLLDWGCIDTPPPFSYKCKPTCPLKPGPSLFGHVFYAYNRSIKYTFMDLVLSQGEYFYTWPVTATLLVPNLTAEPPTPPPDNGNGDGSTWDRIEQFIQEHWTEVAIGGVVVAGMILLWPKGKK